MATAHYKLKKTHRINIQNQNSSSINHTIYTHNDGQLGRNMKCDLQ
jgi:hypothetical protein